jgi:hypothetical protein
MKKDTNTKRSPFEIDPMIDKSIVSLLKTNAPKLNDEDREKFDMAATDPINGQGDQIDIVCWDLGNRHNLEDSTKLKALRLVRAFFRQVLDGKESERGFDYPVLNDYWRSVDQKFMQLVEKQARWSHGAYYGDLEYSGIEMGRIENTHIATIGSLAIAKSAVVHYESPTHVYYRSVEE